MSKSNKKVKRMMCDVLFYNKFLSGVHFITEYDFPMITVWNVERKTEQFARSSRKTVSIKASEVK